MLNLEDKVITLNGNLRYLVVSQINVNNKIYVYLVNDSDLLDVMYMEVIPDKGYKLEPIDPILFEKTIFPLFLDKFNSYEKDTNF